MDELLDDGSLINDGPHEKKKKKLLNILLIGQVLMAFIATYLAIYEDIDTIIKTGPIGSSIGGVVFFVAIWLKNKHGILVAISALVFSLACLLTIYFLNWGPSEANIPISTALVLYSIGLTIFVFSKMLRNR